MIAAGTFREDLFYRLNVVHLRIPPLRERREDVPELLRHFLELFARQHELEMPRVSAPALDHLTAYSWPGNVRELRNVAERLVVRNVPLVLPDDLPAHVKAVTHAPPSVTDPVQAQAADMDRLFQTLLDGASFWDAVYEPFMLRDLTRADLRRLVSRGLERTHGSYKTHVSLFNMRPEDYKRFLNFLRKHDCHLPFQRFRTVHPNLRHITGRTAVV
jgi:DNA-binding NtrC family response regulator